MDGTHSQQRLNLYLDWDGTITESDTLSVVASIGYRCQAQRQRHVTPWSEIVESYMVELKAHESHYVPETAQRTTAEQELLYLASLAEVENRSVRRVENSRLYEGVTLEDLDRTAAEAVAKGEVAIRRGWEDLLSLLASDQGDRIGKLEIISVNWSARFLRACLVAHHLLSSTAPKSDAMTDLERRHPLSGTVIAANEIEGVEQHWRPSRREWQRLWGLQDDDFTGSDGGTHVGTGRLNKNEDSGIRTSRDKARCLPTPPDGSSEREGMQVYVGDSPTDLECLLKADVGILINDKAGEASKDQGTSLLVKTLDRIGIEVRPLASWSASAGKQAREGGLAKLFWEVKDFEDVVRWIKSVSAASVMR